jgi:hypothetical protein
MATNPIYAASGPGGGPGSSSGVNSFGFKAQPVQDNNPMANFLQSTENLGAAAGSSAISGGASTVAAGTGAMAPALQYLTQLTKGDQADVNQAIQPEANRIKDSFQQVRNMISSQPRGGGKAGVLAESGFKEASQVADTAAQARSGAASQLGSLGATLAGVGTQEEGVGAGLLQGSDTAALTQRGQNVGPGSFASQFSSILGAIV